MQVTVRASNGAAVLVWHRFDSYYARTADTTDDPDVCLGVDLFEVIAELAELDLEESGQAAEAVRLADDARRSLTGGHAEDHEVRGEEQEPERRYS
jgi:hypothetical protein